MGEARRRGAREQRVAEGIAKRVEREVIELRESEARIEARRQARRAWLVSEGRDPDQEQGHQRSSAEEAVYMMAMAPYLSRMLR